MYETHQDPSGFRPGDKVRIREGEYRSSRGLISGEAGDQIEVTLSSGEALTVNPNDVTNYSLAARRAWRAMPKKAGRPPSEAKKRQVSLRIESDVWERLGDAVAQGLVASREEAVNRWLREQVERLFEAQ